MNVRSATNLKDSSAVPRDGDRIGYGVDDDDDIV